MKRKVLIILLLIVVVIAAANIIEVKRAEEERHYTEKVGIISLEICSATGDRQNNNYIKMENNFDYSRMDSYTKMRHDRLIGEDAMKVIDEVSALPDTLGNQEDTFAYMILITYYDDNANQVSAEKYGYGIFPDNWSEIVADINAISSDYEQLTDSTDITVIDADLLRHQFVLNNSMLPEGVTVEQFLEDMDFTYMDLFVKHSDIYQFVWDYKYDYYDIGSHKIDSDTEPEPSDDASLLEYAENNLDSIDQIGEYSITGTFEEYTFEIVRFDCFEEWKGEDYIYSVFTNPDGYIDIMHFNSDTCVCESVCLYVYVDPSGRFLVLTYQENWDLINDYFNR
jgi:hypothetical protein